MRVWLFGDFLSTYTVQHKHIMGRKHKKFAAANSPSLSDISFKSVDERRLGDIVTAVVDKATKDLKATVSNIESLLVQQQQLIKTLQLQIKERDEKIAGLEKTLFDVSVNHNKLEEKLDRMGRQLHIELNDLEKYSRKTCIRIQGINIPQNTDTTDAVLSTFKEHLNLTLTKHDIEAAHPLPKSRPDKPAPIIAKLVRISDKENIIYRRRKFGFTRAPSSAL